MENDALDRNVNNPDADPVQKQIPNDVAILVLGIISIVGCFCYGIPGVITGSIALILANGAKRTYELNPEAYTRASYQNMNAGRICAIIGLALSALSFLTSIGFLIFGIASDPYLFDGF